MLIVILFLHGRRFNFLSHGSQGRRQVHFFLLLLLLIAPSYLAFVQTNHSSLPVSFRPMISVSHRVDLYPTYITNDKLLSSNLATKATIIGNCGAVAGGTIAGIISQRLGRRLTMMAFILLIGCFIPLWIIPSGFSSLAAGAFCVQFGVQGAWGVIPIHLAEMSPPAFRATFPGLMYQLGNMVSSASSQIEASESFFLPYCFSSLALSIACSFTFC